MSAYSMISGSSSLSDLYATSRDPTKKVGITWKDIKFETFERNKDKSRIFKPVHDSKVILNGLSGSAELGQLVAILGPTGSGKTSLLNVLAARVPAGGQSFSKLSGSVTVNGKTRSERRFRKMSAYICQDDQVYENLTVFETLMLSANFFLPSSKTKEEKIELVDGVIAEMGLVKVRDSIVGCDEKRGISGGERKRTAIAAQMLSAPTVLFLDEPTSGLDAFQSLALLECLKMLVQHNRLVITTIHQPRSSIYELFDRLLILSQGRTMYFGYAKDAVRYFSSIGHPCPESFTPSDFFLDLLSPDDRTPESEALTRSRITAVGDKWEIECKKNSFYELYHVAVSFKNDSSFALGELAKASQDRIQDGTSGKGSPASTKASSTRDGSSKGSAKAEGIVAEPEKVDGEITAAAVAAEEGPDRAKTFNVFLLLLWRCWTNQFRDRALLVSRFMAFIIFALILGGVYSNIGYSQRSIQNRKGLLFFIVCNQVFLSAMNVLQSFPLEKAIVNRERSYNAYPALSFYVAKVLAELPLRLAPCVVYSVIFYFMVGLQASRFGVFVALMLLTNFSTIALAYAVSAFAPSLDAALSLGAMCVLIAVNFAGYYISVNSLPVVINLLPFVSLIRWGFEAMCINEFTGLQFDCNLANPSLCFQTGEEVLATLDFQNHSLSFAVFGGSMLLIASLVFGYLFLARSTLAFTHLGYTGSSYKRILAAKSPQPQRKTSEANINLDQVDLELCEIHSNNSSGTFATKELPANHHPHHRLHKHRQASQSTEELSAEDVSELCVMRASFVMTTSDNNNNFLTVEKHHIEVEQRSEETEQRVSSTTAGDSSPTDELCAV